MFDLPIQQTLSFFVEIRSLFQTCFKLGNDVVSLRCNIDLKVTFFQVSEKFIDCKVLWDKTIRRENYLSAHNEVKFVVDNVPLNDEWFICLVSQIEEFISFVIDLFSCHCDSLSLIVEFIGDGRTLKAMYFEESFLNAVKIEF